MECKSCHKKMILQLGCGGNRLPDAINIDIVKTQATDLIIDLKEKLPYPDNSIDEIYNWHFVEHFTLTEITKMAKDWHRVLKPNGKVLIAVPDIGIAMQRILAGDTHPDYMKDIYGDWGQQYWMHKWGWMKSTMEGFLKGIGFSKVVVCNVSPECTIPLIKAEAWK